MKRSWSVRSWSGGYGGGVGENPRPLDRSETSAGVSFSVDKLVTYWDCVCF